MNREFLKKYICHVNQFNHDLEIYDILELLYTENGSKLYRVCYRRINYIGNRHLHVNINRYNKWIESNRNEKINNLLDE